MSRFLALGIGAALTWLGAVGLVQAQVASNLRVVGSAEELRAAISDGRSRSPIALRAGIYDLVRIESLVAGTPLVITAADPNAPPTIRRMVVSGSADLVIDRLMFAPEAGEGSLLEITRSTGVEIRQSRFVGSADLALNRRFRALTADDVTGLKVVDSRFEAVERAVVLNKARRVELAHNDFRRLGAGAVDLLASDDVAIVRNRFGGFRTGAARVGSFIHAFTRGAGAPTRNVLIKDNVMMQDTEALADGVTFTNEDRIPYENIEITDNIIVTASPHGITVDRGSNVTVDRNVVLEAESATFNSAIRLLRVEEGSMAGNLATAYAVVESRNVKRSMNGTMPRMDLRARRTYLSRVADGLAGKGEGRIKARRVVTSEHRVSGPRT